jgi:hypothetical protein
MGKWMSTNGEAIYSTEPAPECEFGTATGAECYATKAQNQIYLEVVRWPDGDKPVTVTIRRKGFASAELLDHSLPEVSTSENAANGATVLSIPKPSKTDPSATVFKVTFGGETSK